MKQNLINMAWVALAVVVAVQLNNRVIDPAITKALGK